ncbi:MAG: hypothetical protein KDA38_02125 [Planctomycetales bacterium]|nr:hypothetical protein [Planctomycetales bacterium]
MLRAVERLLEQAKQSVGDIHAIVFPETALTDQQFADVAHMLRNRNISLISGVTREIEAKVSETTASKSDQSVNEPNEAEAKNSLRGRPVFQNYAAVHLPQMFSEPFTFEQGKHHRWKLDHDQIVRYGLSSALNPETDCWENIQVVDRSLHFFAIREWLCTCVLICEDLARLDPVGQFVRAVAPDLVIALLFDGPQLSNRWPAYHATVLADDPGASVLTLTSLGMAKLSRPTNHHGPDHATVIGMWRDASGNFVEIRLPPNSHAAVLTLHHRSRTSVTADGRANPHELGSPVFGGLNYLRIT